MGRRYFCDFCNKSFIDDLEARKKHLSSLIHQQAKYQHYHPYRNPKEILDEESKKTECHKFIKGTCVFGLKCNYSHYSVQELAELRRLVEENEHIEREKVFKQEYFDTDIPSLDEWLKKYKERKCKELEKLEVQTKPIENDRKLEYTWIYNEALEFRQDLPPSLIKFQLFHFVNNAFSEWG